MYAFPEKYIMNISSRNIVCISYSFEIDRFDFDVFYNVNFLHIEF